MNLNLERQPSGDARQRWILLGLLALAAVLVAILGYRQIARLSETTAVWVAREALRAGQVVEAGQLARRRVDTTAVPAGAIFNPGQIVGQRLERSKAAGEVITASDFEAPADKRTPIAQQVPAGRVLVTVPVQPTALPYRELKQGDRLEILAGNKEAGGKTRVVARDCYYIGWLSGSPPRNPQQAPADSRRASALGLDLLAPPQLPQQRGGSSSIALVLGLHPADVAALAEARAAGESLSYAVHGASEVQSGDLLILDTKGTGSVDVIVGRRREQVSLLR